METDSLGTIPRGFFWRGRPTFGGEEGVDAEEGLDVVREDGGEDVEVPVAPDPPLRKQRERPEGRGRPPADFANERTAARRPRRGTGHRWAAVLGLTPGSLSLWW